MSSTLRPIAYVLASTNHGTMIVNRNDYCVLNEQAIIGVGHQIFSKSSFDENEVGFVLALLDCRRKHFGDDVMAVDGGANIGVHTVEWARHMHGWGRVVAFEAQEFVFYALAGNVAINNCLNVAARHAGLGENCGELVVPVPDYFSPASFGSLEMRLRSTTEYIGQSVSYEPDACSRVPMISLDSLNLDRIDLIKLDIEGMEAETLRGGRETLIRHHPILIVEWLKSDQAEIRRYLSEFGYHVFPMGYNLLAVHDSDPTLAQIEARDDQLILDS